MDCNYDNHGNSKWIVWGPIGRTICIFFSLLKGMDWAETEMESVHEDYIRTNDGKKYHLLEFCSIWDRQIII